jgi:hypothetical protein
VSLGTFSVYSRSCSLSISCLFVFKDERGDVPSSVLRTRIAVIENRLMSAMVGQYSEYLCGL